MTSSQAKDFNETMKKSNITKLATSTDVLRTESYDNLMNLRTTLLHMQYLHASLSQKLERQHINQQNQHKDHLIQCLNLRQELEQLRKHNFTKLFIVKLEELLAIEETLSQHLMAQPEIYPKQHHPNPNKSSQPQSNEFQILSRIQKLATFAKIQQEQMQTSLCKLYIGNKVMLDLPKTAQSIQTISQKIDMFLAKHLQTINLYNYKLKEFDQVQSTYKNYLGLIKPKISELNANNQNNPNQQNQTKNQQNQTNNQFKAQSKKPFLYQSHLKNKLLEQQKSLDFRLEQAKNKLLIYS